MLGRRAVDWWSISGIRKAKSNLIVPRANGRCRIDAMRCHHKLLSTDWVMTMPSRNPDLTVSFGPTETFTRICCPRRRKGEPRSDTPSQTGANWCQRSTPLLQIMRSVQLQAPEGNTTVRIRQAFVHRDRLIPQRKPLLIDRGLGDKDALPLMMP